MVARLSKPMATPLMARRLRDLSRPGSEDAFLVMTEVLNAGSAPHEQAVALPS